jgi:hypothetical protein
MISSIFQKAENGGDVVYGKPDIIAELHPLEKWM